MGGCFGFHRVGWESTKIFLSGCIGAPGASSSDWLDGKALEYREDNSFSTSCASGSGGLDGKAQIWFVRVDLGALCLWFQGLDGKAHTR